MPSKSSWGGGQPECWGGQPPWPMVTPANGSLKQIKTQFYSNFSSGRSQSAKPQVGRVPGQGRHGRLAADGRQPRPHPDLQDPVQHLLHPGHLGDGYRLE